MKLLIFLIVLSMTYLTASCAIRALDKTPLTPKEKPEFVGVAPELEPFANEYMKLAKKHGIEFNHDVTMGIKVIGHSPIIGLCWHDDNWREIDIDETFFENASFAQQKILVYHEMTHCHCTRGHDFNGGSYSDFFSKWIHDLDFQAPFLAKPDPGYFEDGCGTSIMTPQIASDDCIQAHEEHYINEMFDRCNPY